MIGISYGAKKMDSIKSIKKDYFHNKKLIIIETIIKCAEKIILLKTLKNIKNYQKNKTNPIKLNSNSILLFSRYNFFPQTYLLPS